MDGTVTRSRTVLAPEMKGILQKLLNEGCDVITVSGQGTDAIRTQVGMGTYFMGQNGNHTVRVADNFEMWNEKLNDVEKKEIYAHIASLPKEEVKDSEDLIEDRGSQIAYSVLGHHEDVAKKEAYDRGGAKRRALLTAHPFVSDTIEIKIAGTTSLDYIRKGKNKGTNIERLIHELGWDKSECVYIGDSLFPGGNDEAVLGVIDTVTVENPSDTIQKLVEELGGS